MSRNYECSTHRYLFGNARKLPEVKQPKYLCASCEKCISSYCQEFKRHVVPRFNRCFNHSFYKPLVVEWKPRADLEEVIQLEQEKISA